MALSTEIEAKSPEDAAPQEIELPSMEPVPVKHGTPGLFGLLSRPAFALRVGLAALLLAAVAALVTPLAFPKHAVRQPPALPPRAPARRPPHLPPTPLPEWMRAPSPQVAQRSGVQAYRPGGGGPHSGGAAPRGAAGGYPQSGWSVQASSAVHLGARPQSAGTRPQRLNARTPEHLNTEHLKAERLTPLPAGPVRIHEPSGAVGVIAPQGVSIGARRVPSEWAREVRRLMVPPASGMDAPAERPALRLLEPDPGDAAVFDPPERLRWSPVPGVDRYMLTLELLTDPAEQLWHPVRDLFLVEVSGTEFSLPADMKWAPGALYRWRVQTSDGRATAAGRFRVLSEAQRARLLGARRDFGGSRLLRAAIYRSFGLNDAALTELRSLRSLQPENPALQRAAMIVQADIRRQRAAAGE